MKDQMDVMQGTLDLIILKGLSAEPMHAWGIGERIERMSQGVFRLGQGTVYPAVRRLESRGWVTSLWRQTENNRIARYYELTPAGRHALSRESARWRSYVSAVDRLIDAHP